MGDGGGGDFVAKTLVGIAGSLERAVFSEESARLPGLLQGADPRSKVVAGLMLLIKRRHELNQRQFDAVALLDDRHY